MLDETKNLKDSTSTSNIALKDSSFSMSYTKTNKLISALYMVTDIMEKEEPLRNKLRTLGADIISDTYLLTTPNRSIKVRSINTDTRDAVEIRIAEVLSFLEISFSINLISEMNYNILKKEFIELSQSIRKYIEQSNGREPATLSEFFLEETQGQIGSGIIESFHKGHPASSKGHALARIGVQKGSTLLRALSKVGVSDTSSFDNLKKERRNEILSIVKNGSGTQGSTLKGVTITDIRARATGPIAVCGEKTLQRELISMVKDNLLKKAGEKRWSRYFLP